MAQGNLLQGQGTGKVGDLVFMVRQGVQVARVYTKAGARSGDAASEASRIQRVRFGAASNQWSLYRYVCTRMFRKGKGGNQSDYNYFVKKNQALLPYLTKQENAEGVHCIMPGQFSEGNLGRIELTYYIDAETQEGKSSYRVIDSHHLAAAQVNWNQSLSLLKEQLKISYPNASKVTYLFSFAPTILSESAGVDYESQAVQHTAVTIELYKEATPGENSRKVAEYFAARFTNPDLATFIGSQTVPIFSRYSTYAMQAATSDERDWLKNLSVLVFATDENASDCYTTIVPADAVPPTDSVWALYASYRTASALRLACESYGYQSGVMRDDIAAYGNDLQQQRQAYAARLRSLGLDIESAEE